MSTSHRRTYRACTTLAVVVLALAGCRRADRGNDTTMILEAPQGAHLRFDAPRGKPAQIFVQPVADADARLRYAHEGEPTTPLYHHEAQLGVGRAATRDRVARYELTLLRGGAVLVKHR